MATPLEVDSSVVLAGARSDVPLLIPRAARPPINRSDSTGVTGRCQVPESNNMQIFLNATQTGDDSHGRNSRHS